MSQTVGEEWWSHRLTLAGPVRRGLAFLLDVCFATIAAAGYYAAFCGFYELAKRARFDLWNDAAFRSAIFEVRYEAVGLIGMIYMIVGLVCEASPLGGSFGKRLCGIHVTDEYGEELTITATILRNLTKIVSIGALGLGCLMIFWTRGNRALHDFAAGSFVARG